MVLSSAKRQIAHPIGIGIDVDPPVTKCACHDSSLCSLFLILRRRFLIFVLGAAAAGVASLIWTAPTIDALLSVGLGSSSDVSGNDMFSGRVDYLWLPLLSEWTSDIGLSLFGAGRYGIVTSTLWDTGNLIHADHAHNAISTSFSIAA